ncbi:MAG: TIGR02996 domain-containing protein [Planctomycetaceae bacterium]
MDEQSFLDEICSHPDDDTPRLIYADWLEEQGNARGEFIRVQCEMATLKKTQVRYRELVKREQMLLFRHQAEWLSAFPLSVRRHVFRRGFVEECAVAVSYFLRNWEKLLRLTPLRHVTFTMVKDQLPLLAEIPGLAKLESVEFKKQDRHHGIVEFARSPYLHGLKKINNSQWTSEGLLALAASPYTTTLTELEFPYCRFQRDAIEAITKSPGLAGLQRLIIPGTLTESVFPLFANATFAHGLQELNVHQMCLQDSDLSLLASGSQLKNLSILRANNTSVGEGVRGSGLIDLAHSPQLANLRQLVMQEHPLSYESLVALGESQYRTKGARFFLGGNRWNSPLNARQIRDIQTRFGKSFGNL